jgi:hypothetical protein
MLDIVLGHQRLCEVRLHWREHKKSCWVTFDNEVNRAIAKMTNAIINHDVPMLARDL